MNQLTICLTATNPGTIRKAGSTEVCELMATAEPLNDNDGLITLRVQFWGKAATEASQIIPGTSILVAGSLNLQKDQPITLNVNKWNILTTPTAAFNAIALVGRAGRDPEVRYFDSGNMVANLTLAVNRIGRDVPPDWFNLSIWGKQAQVAADYVSKGSLLGITGNLKMETWTDRTSGEERSKPVINVDRLNLLGSRREQEQYAPSDEERPF